MMNDMQLGGVDLERLRAGAAVTSKPTMIIKTDVVKTLVEELAEARAALRFLNKVDDLDEFIREQGPEFAALVKITGLQAELAAEKEINAKYGCPDCGVHSGCDAVVTERNALRAVVTQVLRFDSLTNFFSAVDAGGTDDPTELLRAEIANLIDDLPDPS